MRWVKAAGCTSRQVPKPPPKTGNGAPPRAVQARLRQHSCFFLHEWLPNMKSLAQGPQRHCPPTPGRCSHGASLIALQREWGREARGRPTPAPHPSPSSSSRAERKKAHHLPTRPACGSAPQRLSALARHGQAAAARALAPRANGPQEGPGGAGPGPGSSCAARPAWPLSSETAGSGWMVGSGGRGGPAGTAGEGVRRAREWPPDSAPRRSPAPGHPRSRARGARRPAVLGRPFIPARSAEARPTRAANPRPRVAAAPARERGSGYRRSEPGKRRVRPG